MNDFYKTTAWLECGEASKIPVEDSCSIGRATSNQIILSDEKVSRVHALIHRQGDFEFWLVDLGSSNGSYLNGRRVSQPMVLNDGAVIKIGSSTLRFRLSAGKAIPDGESHSGERTVRPGNLVAIQDALRHPKRFREFSVAHVFSNHFWTNLFTADLAIDLGTASVLIHTRQAGRVVIFEPSIVALNTHTGEVEAVGDEAKQLLGRAPQGVVTVRPMKDGMIYEVDAAEKMLAAFIKKARPNRKLNTRIVVSVPPRAHQVARRAVKQVCYDAKASDVFLVDQTMVAAMGAGLAINEKRGCMIVDIGGGTTDVAVISYNGKVFSDSLLIAGDEMDEAIIKFIREKYNVLISETAAEDLKWNLGSAYPSDKLRTMSISGRDQFEGLPKTLVLNDAEIREALSDPVSAIVDMVRKALNDTPPQLAADLIDRGICLTGGGSKIQGLDIRISKETHLPCYRAENPETAVVRGTAILLDDIPFLRRIQILD